ncbi:hypothetical protein EGW08_007500 [Elysia chlorotica]|uniref:Uncharacterized protein n=1 Tax=Elysia chlorotica TaxID=188477 RepID=A0A433TT98_ELYCH|nr:hypothetical protein EGW08_007500 [Elysia chlorotica]
MGGEYSVGQDNDDLIDKLKEKDYIRTVEVERVFRMVDRAHYYLEENRKTAYEDIAWRNGLLHMSAPCIYSKVMEALELRRGMSFLNLGSGTGYLNTLVGYSIGPFGINHGIELHADNVAYAKKRLEEFIQNAPRFDDLELCKPKFVVGNCLNLSAENRLYDRVYCGAACPPEQQEVLQNMIKIGGTLITPVGDQLLKIRRLTATEFTSENILPVSFASLIVPILRDIPDEPVLMPEVHPLSLQDISRIVVRNAIRSTFEFNLPVAKASQSRRKGGRSEASNSSLYQGLRLFNFVPTRDGIMVMGYGVHGDRPWSQQILPVNRRTPGTSNVAADSDSDDTTADENIEGEEERDDDEGDGNLLDRQLLIHAQALRRLRERSSLNSSDDIDVDSDISDIEVDHQPSLSSPEDVNGNLRRDEEHASSSSHSEGQSNSSNENRKALKKGDSKKGKINATISKKGKVTKVLPPHFEDNEINREQIDEDQQDSNEGWESSSYTFDEDICMLNKRHEQHTDTVNASRYSSGSPSMMIEVPASSAPTQPCTIQKQVSYSTSADTSETSGFGSLGDDTALLSESFKDGPASLCSDGFHGMSAEPGSSKSLNSSSLDCNRESVDEGIESHPAMAWMDVDDDGDTAHHDDLTTRNKDFDVPRIGVTLDDEARPSLSRDLSDDDVNHENSSDNFDSDNDMNRRQALARFPRLVKRDQSSSEESDNSKETEESGDEQVEENKITNVPDFSSYLKEKVDTLPIPNSIKAFILHYR